jgi:hypothetical protein
MASPHRGSFSGPRKGRITSNFPGFQDARAEKSPTRLQEEPQNLLLLFKQAILLYRRHRAAHTEYLTEKTFHLELASTLEADVKALDALVNEGWFQEIEPRRLRV